jgi:hypothetical protein
MDGRASAGETAVQRGVVSWWCRFDSPVKGVSLWPPWPLCQQTDWQLPAAWFIVFGLPGFILAHACGLGRSERLFLWCQLRVWRLPLASAPHGCPIFGCRICIDLGRYG